ncbi:hypothetical protein HpBGD53_03340 [Helicobacter pylori]|uniref:hypothetical protein n=1 Tax=Helicobacter pylori TaxID=210 RepID=UPI00308E1545|nr:hypothetical protein KVC21_00300 [Helicobacter pylori]
MISGVIGQPMKIGARVGSFEFIKTLFQDFPLLLNDVPRIFYKQIGIVSVPLPLVGLTYAPPKEVELLKFSYSEYPYMDKSVVVNSYKQEPTKFSIIAYRPLSVLPVDVKKGDSAIQSSNNVIVNFVANEVAYNILQLYARFGGTFSLVTQWGIVTNLVLESLKGVSIESKTMGGEAFLFEFKRVLFAKDTKGTLEKKLLMKSQGLV